MPSFLRIPILRFVGFKIGKKVTIAPFSIIAADEIEFGNNVYISPLVLFFNLKRVKLGNGVYISLGTLVHGHGLGKLEMGDFSATGLFCVINCTCDVILGRYSCLGPRTFVATHGNFLPKNVGFSNHFGSIKIGSYVWIMLDVKITPGVIIGDYVIAHSGTVISTNIPDNSVHTHARESFRTYPMNVIYRKTVNDEYINKWKAALFFDLPSFMKDYFDMKIDCVAEEGRWVLNTPKGRVTIWDKDAIGDLSKIEYGKHDIIIAFKESDINTMQSFRKINWLDINSNFYNKARSSRLFDRIIFYFALKYAVFFTIYEA
jgi:acetyltransferase-like isoleucine patch superfamily enzyme